MAKRGFNGEDTFEEPHQSGPVIKTHNCKAHGCPLAGSLDGVCANHWIAHTHDWPRVTATLVRMRSLIEEANRARKVLCDPHSIPGVAIKGHIAAAERIAGDLSEEQVEAFKAKPPHDYRGWAYMLESMITAAVMTEIKQRRTPDDLEHPAYRARVRAAQVPGQAADFLANEGLSI